MASSDSSDKGAAPGGVWPSSLTIDQTKDLVRFRLLVPLATKVPDPWRIGADGIPTLSPPATREELRAFAGGRFNRRARHGFWRGKNFKTVVGAFRHATAGLPIGDITGEAGSSVAAAPTPPSEEPARPTAVTPSPPRPAYPSPGRGPNPARAGGPPAGWHPRCRWCSICAPLIWGNTIAFQSRKFPLVSFSWGGDPRREVLVEVDNEAKAEEEVVVSAPMHGARRHGGGGGRHVLGRGR